MGTSRGTSASPASSVRRAAADVARNVHAALGADDAWVRVALPDWAGRLRVLASAGAPDVSGRRRSSRRRQVFETGRHITVPLRSAGGDTLAILPLTADAETLGILELVAPADRVADRQEAILALVRQSGALVKISLEREATERTAVATERLLSLASVLNAAMSPVAAMAALADACWQHLGAPVAVARPDRLGDGWYLAAAAGIGSRRRADLRQRLRALPFPRYGGTHARDLKAVFAGTVAPDADAFSAGDAVVLVGGVGAQTSFVAAGTSLLEHTLRRLTGHNGHPDDVGMGIAWTAHELRGPLVGATAALEYVLSSDGGAERLDLLRRTKAELERLTDIIDPLLHWSILGGKLRTRRSDLVQVVRQAVASTALDFEDRQVHLTTPERLEVHADVMHLRSAIANVIRNALVYSPADSPVEVDVEDHGTFARVCIHDRGPGVPPSERDAVFEPFVRGRAGRGARTGNGLGLFIARRVAEAHGGALRLDRPKGKGASFCFDLPRGGVDPRASAS